MAYQILIIGFAESSIQQNSILCRIKVRAKSSNNLRKHFLLQLFLCINFDRKNHVSKHFFTSLSNSTFPWVSSATFTSLTSSDFGALYSLSRSKTRSATVWETACWIPLSDVFDGFRMSLDFEISSSPKAESSSSDLS